MKKDQKLFWSYVDRSAGPKACWPWQRGTFDSGYGCVAWGDKTKGTHTVAYELGVGPVPKGLIVRHSCDNRICCNPHHLLVGTKKDNAHDAMSRDRHSRGERQGLSKLTDEEVRYIREIYVPNKRGFGTVALAKQFGVCQATVWYVIKGSTWKHVHAG